MVLRECCFGYYMEDVPHFIIWCMHKILQLNILLGRLDFGCYL